MECNYWMFNSETACHYIREWVWFSYLEQMWHRFWGFFDVFHWWELYICVSSELPAFLLRLLFGCRVQVPVLLHHLALGFDWICWHSVSRCLLNCSMPNVILYCYCHIVFRAFFPIRLRHQLTVPCFLLHQVLCLLIVSTSYICISFILFWLLLTNYLGNQCRCIINYFCNLCHYLSCPDGVQIGA
jgi:hypothetical protein